MHALLGSFNSGNWSDSKVLDSAGLRCCAFTRNRGAISYACLNAILVELSLTRGICGRRLIRIRLNYHEESGFSITGDTIRTHEHC